MKTLKERAEIFRAKNIGLSEKFKRIIGAPRLEDYRFIMPSLAEQVDFAGDLIKDQQARIEELEAANKWKPIAEMPEKLKDGRDVLLKEHDTRKVVLAYYGEPYDNKDAWRQVGDGRDLYYMLDYGVTHFMEVPEVE